MRRPKSPKPKVEKSRTLVLLDTGPIVGLYNENDDWHKRCKDFFGSNSQYDYLLTQAVISEVIFHIQQGKNAKAASSATINFLKLIEDGVFKVHELEDGYIVRISKLRAKYIDKKLAFADLSLVLAAEDLQIDTIVTIDQKDFGYLKFEKRIGKRKIESGFTVILPEQS